METFFALKKILSVVCSSLSCARTNKEILGGLVRKIIGYRRSRSAPGMVVPKKVEIIKKYSEGKCIDVGCGHGDYLPYFRYKMLIGVDLDPLALKLAKSRNTNAHLVLADAREMPFRFSSFDFVWCSRLIEHMNEYDGRRLLREFERICCKDAAITIATPNFSIIFKFVVQRFLGGFNPSHLTLYDVEKLKKLGFQMIGLSIASELTIEHTLFGVPLLRKMGDLVAKTLTPVACSIIALKRVKKLKRPEKAHVANARAFVLCNKNEG